MNLTKRERKLFRKIADMCLINGLNLRYAPEVSGLVHIDDLQFNTISEGYLIWEHETPTEVLDRIIAEVTEYLEGVK